jgi:hypothetical protein
MKSSETPTESPAEAGGAASLLDRLGGRVDLVIHAGLVVLGFLIIVHINGWRWSAPVFFLCAGWAGLLVSAQFLWKTAMAAAAEGEDDDDEGFGVASTRRDDLLREKRSVLKAIKEIEFDHAMDKMSREDADELLAIYRRRAIAIIKELEGGDSGSVADIIDREVKARLAVDGAAKGGKRKGAKAKPKPQPRAGSEDDAPERASGDEIESRVR